MAGDAQFSFEDFSVEMEDFEVVRTKKHDRMYKLSEGGSMSEIPLVHEGIMYIGTLNHNLYAVDMRDGRMLWKFRTGSFILESSPCWWNGRIFFGSYDKHMYSLDARSGELIWKFPTHGRVNSPPLVADGRIYFGSEDRYFYCLDAEDGSLIWRYKTYDEVQSFPAVHDGRVYFGSFDHSFYCLDAGTGSLIWKFQTQGEIYIMNPPLIHDGKIFFPSFDNFLRAVELDTGKLVWKYRTGNYGNVCCPLLHKGMLYASSRDGFLFCLTPDGKEAWKFTRPEPVSLPEIYDERIYIGCEDQNLYCLNLKGEVLWKFRTEGAVWLKAVGCGKNVLFPCWDCNVYLIDAETGRLVWRFRTEGDPSPFPAAYEAFELVIRKPADEERDEGETRGKYDIDAMSEGGGKFYKSRITYQVSSRYQEKGKYQTDSDEDEL